MQASCYDSYDHMNCDAAALFCETELMGPAIAFGVNIYDVSKQCEGGLEDTGCYPRTK
jgi:hypothetical protein